MKDNDSSNIKPINIEPPISNFYKQSIKNLKLIYYVFLICIFLLLVSVSMNIRLYNLIQKKSPDIFLLHDTLSTPFVYYGDSDSISRPYQLKMEEKLINFTNLFSFFYTNIVGDNAPFFYEKSVYFFHKNFYTNKIKQMWESPGWLLKEAQMTKAISNSYILDFKITFNKDPYRVYCLVFQTFNPYTTNEQRKLVEYNLEIKESIPNKDNPWGLSIVNMTDKSTLIDESIFTDLQQKYPDRIK